MAPSNLWLDLALGPNRRQNAQRGPSRARTAPELGALDPNSPASQRNEGWLARARQLQEQGAHWVDNDPAATIRSMDNLQKAEHLGNLGLGIAAGAGFGGSATPRVGPTNLNNPKAWLPTAAPAVEHTAFEQAAQSYNPNMARILGSLHRYYWGRGPIEGKAAMSEYYPQLHGGDPATIEQLHSLLTRTTSPTGPARGLPAWAQTTDPLALESPGNPHIGGVTSNHALSAQQQWLRQQAEQAGLSFRTQSLPQMAADRFPAPPPPDLPDAIKAPYSDYETNFLSLPPGHPQAPAVAEFARQLSSGALDQQLGFENRMAVARTLDPAMAPPDPLDEYAPPIPRDYDPRSWRTKSRDSFRPWGLELGSTYQSWRTDKGTEAPTSDAVAGTRDMRARMEGPRSSYHPVYSQSWDIRKGGWGDQIALSGRGERPRKAFTPKPASIDGSSFIDADFKDAPVQLEGKKLLHLDEPLRPDMEADLLSRLEKSTASLTRAGHSRPALDILIRNGITGKDQQAALGALKAGTFPTGLPARVTLDLLNAIWPNRQVGTRYFRDTQGFHGGSGNARGYLLPQVPGAPKTQGLSNRKYHRLFDPPETAK